MDKDNMKKIGKRELREYIKGLIKDNDLSDMCEEIIFENKFPGIITVFEIERLMVINLPRFYQTLEKDGITGSLANLILLQAVNHEIEHLRQFKDAHKERKNDDKTFAVSKSFDYSMSSILHTTGDRYFALYHEYDADICSIDRILNNAEFRQIATLNGPSDLYLFNEHMAKRILRRYRVEETNTSPLELFIHRAQDESNYLTPDEALRLESYMRNRGDSLSNMLLGKPVESSIIEKVSLVSDGKKKTENILSLIK